MHEISDLKKNEAYVKQSFQRFEQQAKDQKAENAGYFRQLESMISNNGEKFNQMQKSILDQNMRFGDLYRALEKNRRSCDDYVAAFDQENKDAIMDLEIAISKINGDNEKNVKYVQELKRSVKREINDSIKDLDQKHREEIQKLDQALAGLKDVDSIERQVANINTKCD